MLSYEKLSRRPESFRRPTGVDLDLFNGMTEKIQSFFRNCQLCRRSNTESVDLMKKRRGAVM